MIYNGWNISIHYNENLHTSAGFLTIDRVNARIVIKSSLNTVDRVKVVNYFLSKLDSGEYPATLDTIDDV